MMASGKSEADGAEVKALRSRVRDFEEESENSRVLVEDAQQQVEKISHLLEKQEGINRDLEASHCPDERDDDGKPRCQRARVTPETFHRVIVSLRHNLDAGIDCDNDQKNDNKNENFKSEHQKASHQNRCFFYSVSGVQPLEL